MKPLLAIKKTTASPQKNLIKETERKDIKEPKAMASPPSLDQKVTNSDTSSNSSTPTDESSSPMVNPIPSTSGIFFQFPFHDSYIFNSFTTTQETPVIFVPNHFTICSSSKGLILCYDSDYSTYHLFNPFIQKVSTNYRHIPASRFHIDCYTAVLSVDKNLPAFEIVCAVEDNKGKYMFDWYSSGLDRWVQLTTEADNISPSRIKNHTGISNDSGIAFWITDDLTAVVTFDPMDDSTRRFYLPLELQNANKIELGKISEEEIGVVVLRESMIAVYIVEYNNYSWKRYRVLDLIGAGFMERIQPGSDQIVYLPSLIRFDRDVVISVGTRSILWEMSSGNEINCEDAKFHELAHWELRPRPNSDTVPYVFSDITPAQFLVFEEVDGGDDQKDEEESSGEQGDGSEEDGRDLKRRRRD